MSHDDCTEIAEMPTEMPDYIGHFEIEELIGSGGFGAVWRARDTKLERTVAIKIPRRDRVSTLEGKQFFREARAAAQLRHPNIIGVHEVGRDEAISYIVSDFVEGSPLSRWRRSHRVSPRQSAELCAKIADALHHAHECGIVHRDVKPSNIMMDEHGEPHVMDFGLAKRDAGENQTMAIDGLAFGTPSFMSPEQARGEAATADRRSDLYSLGVILFQLLTDELPFRGSSRAVVQQVIDEDPPHAMSLNRSIPQDLDTICWKLMEKAPQRRYETGKDVADELRRFLRGEPILARPISHFERLLRWYDRNRMVGTLALACAAALLLGTIGSTTQWLRAQRHAASAEQSARDAELAADREKHARADAEHFLYIARMNTAQQAFELNDLARVQRILDAYAEPPEVGEDPRGFEWYYWDRQSRRWRERFDGHTAPVLAVDVSREGRWFVSSSHDGTVRVWDAAGAQAPRIIKAHEGSVYGVALSPIDNTIASCGRDQYVRIWDRATGDLLKEWKAHDGTVFCLAFSKDGARLATGGSDTLAKLWDMESTTKLQTFAGHEDFVYSVDLSDDGTKLASGGLDRNVILWDVESGAATKTFSGHLLEVWDVAFSPDGSVLASASADTTIRLWDVESEAYRESLEGHTDRVRSIVFSPDGKLLVSAGHDRTLRIWDLTVEPKPLSVPFRNLKRSPNHFFERMNLPESKQSFSHVGHTGPVTSVAFGQDGATLVTGGEDFRVVSWQLSDLTEARELDVHSGSINAAVYSSDGQLIATASNDRTVQVWECETMQPVGEPFAHDQRVFSVAFSPDLTKIVSGTYDGTVTVWNREDRTRLVFEGHDGGVSKVAFSPYGEWIASAGHDRTVRVWKADAPETMRVLKGHEDRVLNLSFWDSGKMIVSTGRDNTVRIWDTETGELLHGWEAHGDTIWGLDVSGNLLATGGEDRSIKLWDLTTRELVRTMRGHGDLVQSLAFSPDGKTLASGSADKTIRLWDVQTGESKSSLKGHDYRVWSVAFDPLGTTLASSSYNLRFWKGAPDRLER